VGLRSSAEGLALQRRLLDQPSFSPPNPDGGLLDGGAPDASPPDGR
jgi:hypothetical protein